MSGPKSRKPGEAPDAAGPLAPSSSERVSSAEEGKRGESGATTPLPEGTASAPSPDEVASEASSLAAPSTRVPSSEAPLPEGPSLVASSSEAPIPASSAPGATRQGEARTASASREPPPPVAPSEDAAPSPGSRGEPPRFNAGARSAPAREGDPEGERSYRELLLDGFGAGSGDLAVGFLRHLSSELHLLSTHFLNEVEEAYGGLSSDYVHEMLHRWSEQAVAVAELELRLLRAARAAP